MKFRMKASGMGKWGNSYYRQKTLESQAKENERIHKRKKMIEKHGEMYVRKKELKEGLLANVVVWTVVGFVYFLNFLADNPKNGLFMILTVVVMWNVWKIIKKYL